jgi:hypothetical protein
VFTASITRAMMEFLNTSKTVYFYDTIWRNALEDSHLHKSYGILSTAQFVLLKMKGRL